MHATLAVAAALLLLFAASDLFTNAVEWLGAIFGMTRSAMGAVVAAIGSSIPETMVAVVAFLVLRDEASREVGVGAVLGAPFMLSTVVFGATGMLVLARRSKSMRAQPGPAVVGLATFVVTLTIAVAASQAPPGALRWACAALLLVAYAGYLVYHLRLETLESEEHPPPLRFAPRHAPPHLWLVLAQLGLSLVVTVLASRWFVVSVTDAARAANLAPFIVSLFLSPIATELPEMANVWLWVRRGQDDLAFSNVLGAMMFQTTVASAIAIAASKWDIGHSGLVAAGAAMLAVLLVLGTTIVFKRVSAIALAACAGLYILYVVVGLRL